MEPVNIKETQLDYSITHVPGAVVDIPTISEVCAKEELSGGFSNKFAGKRPELLVFNDGDRSATTNSGFYYTYLNALKKIAANALLQRAELQIQSNKVNNTKVNVDEPEKQDYVKWPSPIDDSIKKWKEDHKGNEKYYTIKKSMKAPASIYYNAKRSDALIEASQFNTSGKGTRHTLDSKGRIIYNLSDSDINAIIAFADGSKNQLYKELMEQEWPTNEKVELTKDGWVALEKYEVDIIQKYLKEDKLDAKQTEKFERIKQRVEEGFAYPDGWQYGGPKPRERAEDKNNALKSIIDLSANAYDTCINFAMAFVVNVINDDQLWVVE